MRHIKLSAAALAGLFVQFAAHGMSYPTVAVGSPGNAGNPNSRSVTLTTVANFGAVGYAYNMGKFEVSNSQYVEFLNTVDPSGTNALGLFNTTSAANTSVLNGIVKASSATAGNWYSVKPNSTMTISGNTFPITYADKPVVYVSWPDMMRLANWMHNGQGTGSTESGSYALNGVLAPASPPAREPGATWVLPSIDEWHKAAYYNPATSSYVEYATGSNTLPNNPQPPSLSLVPDPGGSVNFKKTSAASGNLFAVTQQSTTDSTVLYFNNVGDYSNSGSLYGTFDQNGNVSEYIHLLGSGFQTTGSAYTSGTPVLGTTTVGGFAGTPLPAAFTGAIETSGAGFRLAYVPEPASLGALSLLGLAALRRRTA
jgi:formylglycine-generating enzyme required for sulfatase activity